MARLYQEFDRLDGRINRWLVTHSILFLRISMGGVFLAFGLLKFFPGLSPIEGLATRTTEELTLGIFSSSINIVLVATLECAIGLCFIAGRFLRIATWLLLVQMLGAMSPLLLFPGKLFPGPIHAPTLAAQYIIKDVVLIAAALVMAATWTGARLVPESRSFKSSLRARPQRSFGQDDGDRARHRELVG